MLTRWSFLCAIAFIQASGGSDLPERDASRYRQLVADYRRQDFTSVSTVAAFSPEDVRSSTARATDAVGAWAADDLRAAAMLHTEASIELLTKAQSDAAFLHLHAAIRLINDAVIMDQPSQRFASVWYSSVGATLSRLGAPVWATDMADRARSIVPTSAGVAPFQKGLDLEVTACEIYEGDTGDRFGLKRSRPFESAATLFGDALRSDPSLHTAALHLGRARMMQGSLDQARQNLEIGARSARPSERYLALLFLGAIAERTGDFAEAEARYRSAVHEFKWGQSGPLALARLLSRTSREREARDVVAALLARGANTMDPLWIYLARPEQEPEAHLALLRAEVWR
jgi:tetratricopeptide (TPR) repeat protein